MADEDKTTWAYNTDGKDNAGKNSSKKTSRTVKISWTASEYIEHKRRISWYFMLALATVLTATLVYFMTKDYFATGTIVVLGVIVGVFVLRKPEEVTYELSASGLKAGEKFYEYGTFKSFSIIQDGALTSLSLYPIKRFMPPISVYFAPDEADKILAVLGEHLPYEERALDGVERLSRRLRL